MSNFSRQHPSSPCVRFVFGQYGIELKIQSAAPHTVILQCDYGTWRSRLYFCGEITVCGATDRNKTV